MERNLAAYLKGPRRSGSIGVMTLTPVVLLYVQASKSGSELWPQLAAGLIVLSFIGLLSLITFENVKWRSLPISVLTSMWFGAIIIGTLAGVTVSTPDQVLQASLHFMALFGLYGFCAAIMGVMIHKSFGDAKP